MELLLDFQKKRIFTEIVKGLVRHSVSYSPAKKFGFAEKSKNKSMPFLKSNVPKELPAFNAVPAKSPPLMQGGIENVAGELRTENYRVSLKPMPQQREINRPALQPARIVIPEQRLPPHFQYLQPTPTNKDIDLGKLNPLIKDPMVKIIDCPGPDQSVVVTGNMGTKKTGIMLGRDEINEIVEKFSKESKIPSNEGVFRVVVGRLIFLAIISEIIGSRFTLRKMIAAPGMIQGRR